LVRPLRSPPALRKASGPGEPLKNPLRRSQRAFAPQIEERGGRNARVHCNRRSDDDVRRKCRCPAGFGRGDPTCVVAGSVTYRGHAPSPAPRIWAAALQTIDAWGSSKVP
jgi:hypothetical protein